MKGEGILKKAILVCLMFTVLVTFLGKTAVQTNNSELQRLKSKIENQEKINLGMQMKINELASLDNALEVADTFNLEYNNSHIRVISE